ncbi:MAG: DUF4845 domain-containing protein [Methylacidiphilales bacterium]|nr:DUF4845 domain-containing protein [Candidatus Methylacidiphilales bacterium]
MTLSTIVSRQKGIFLWLFGIPALGFILTLGIKLVPYYIEYKTVEKVVNDFVNLPEIRGLSSESIRFELEKKLSENDIKNVDKSTIKIIRKEGSRDATIIVTFFAEEEIVSGYGFYVRLLKEAYLPAP